MVSPFAPYFVGYYIKSFKFRNFWKFRNLRILEILEILEIFEIDKTVEILEIFEIDKTVEILEIYEIITISDSENKGYKNILTRRFTEDLSCQASVPIRDQCRGPQYKRVHFYKDHPGF